MANFVIVDDSRIARKFLKTVLTENGHNVIGEASNGEEGYELYTKLMPDIITIDITMPVLSGMECLKKIKAEFPNAKAVMITAIGSEKSMNKALDEGALAYIVKPFDPENVSEIIESCLNKNK